MVPHVHESLFRLLNEGLYHYFILISIPTASTDTAHSPSALATRLVRFPASLGWCHLIALFSDHQRTMSLKSPHLQVDEQNQDHRV